MTLLKNFTKFVTLAICLTIALPSSALILLPAHAQSLTGAWRLTVSGLVRNPLNVTLAEIAAMPKKLVTATIYCVDFPSVVVESGEWAGVTLASLLEEANVTSSGVKVGFFASDGYSTDLDLDFAMSGEVVVAYEKDGIPLDETLRLVVPGRWGYKWISQLTSIVVYDYDFKGKWESAGYSDYADIQSGSGAPSFPQAPSTTAPGQQPESPESSSTPISNSTAPSSGTSDLPPTQEETGLEPSSPSSDYQVQLIYIGFLMVAIFVGALFALYSKRRA